MSVTAFLDEVSDPVLALEGTRIRHLNEAAREAFAVTDDLQGESMEQLFCQDDALAEQYGDALEHYTDVGGIIDERTRHFDLSHPTIATLRDGHQSLPDPDVGIFSDGRLRYYHLRSSPTEGIDGVDQVIIFRDVTRLKGRERDLTFLKQVLTRILRHNMRNELTVVMGNTQTIQQATEEPIPTLAAEALASCASLMETSEKARTIQQAIEADEQVVFHLPRVVTDVVTTYEDGGNADISADMPDVSVRANPNLPDALNEVVENGIDHSETTPTISITADREGPWATISVADDGPGIPEKELDTLERRGETRLVHGTGAGLWLVYTVVQESDGDLVYESDDSGTTVKMQLPLADGPQRG